MQNKNIQSAYLDEWVILTMVFISIAALMFAIFRYSKHEYCSPFDVSTKAEFFRTGEPIRFQTNATGIRSLQWDFGDSKGNQTRINSAVHVYDQPGEYLVSLTLNDMCSEYKTVYISKAPRLENPLLTPLMFCPQAAEVGKPVQFKDSTNGARNWEWRFGETATIDATSSEPTYTYQSAGLKTVSLVVNGNPQQLAVCKLYVSEPVEAKSKLKGGKTGGSRQPSFVIVPAKPVTPSLDAQQQPTVEAPKPKAESINRPDLELRLRKVADGLVDVNAFAPFLCGNLNAPVSLNGQEITFAQLCNKLAALKNSKQIKTLNVQQIKNGETNCIISLNVNLKTKKGFLGIF